MLADLTSRLETRKQQGNLRKLKLTSGLIDFSSNDSLGLSRSSALRNAVIQEWDHHPPNLTGLGSTGSRLLTGNSAYAEKLEEHIAAFHGFEAGLLFNCGYMANCGLLSAVATAQDVIFFDTEVHRSTRDGIHLSRAQSFPFRHNDLMHLEERLKKCLVLGNGKRLICIESLYSIDGSKAPLCEICQLAKRYEAHLIVDEAHAVGLYGPHGKGLVAEHSLQHAIFAQVTTFGKALGVHGAIVLGSHTLKQHLINFAPSFIYTTALPFLALAAIRCSYKLLPHQEKERKQLKKLIQFFRDNYPQASTTHIQPIYVQGNSAVKQLSQTLIEKGFDVRALMSPTVARGKEQLRICLHAFNAEREITDLLEHINTHMSPIV